MPRLRAYALWKEIFYLVYIDFSLRYKRQCQQHLLYALSFDQYSGVALIKTLCLTTSPHIVHIVS